jgi:SWI/SNF-related matrix-associated actin-dependent regulator 1 of chromatin subfamily A
MFGLSCDLLLGSRRCADGRLGKTVQAIAFLAHLLTIGIHGPHLIVVPSSTLGAVAPLLPRLSLSLIGCLARLTADNWMRELSKWCPGLDVLAYQGSQADRAALQAELTGRRARPFDVLVTT